MEDLGTQCYRAVLNLRKKNLEIELDEYTYVLGFAKPEMEAFDKLIKIVEDLLRKIKEIDKALKEI
jgi:D-mannonate dehydratase